MKLVQIIAGIGMVIGGGLLLLAWNRERKYPDQKKLGLAFIAIGCLVALSAFL
jgi:hypothetical protein